MEFTLRDVLLAFLATFSISYLVTPIFRKIALRVRILDTPNQAYKTHSVPIPYLGGAAIVVTILLIGIPLVFTKQALISIQSGFLIILAAPFLLSVLGLIDDLKNLSAKNRLIVQTIVAIFVSFLFYINDYFGSPSGFASLDVILSCLWIVGITNSINLLDNVDGGAAGVVIISSIFLTIIAIAGDQQFLGTLSALITGAAMGFLIWNFHPAKIYLGDSGSLFLGSVISVLLLRVDTGAPNVFTSWIVVFLLAAIPILDTTVVVLSRVAKRVSAFTGARDHIAHRLMNSGLTTRQTSLVIWGLTVYFCSLGTLLNFSTNTQSIYVCIVSLASWIILLLYFLKL